jgi:hypothetical protein
MDRLHRSTIERLALGSLLRVRVEHVLDYPTGTFAARALDRLQWTRASRVLGPF